MHPPVPRREPEASSRVVPLPVTPRRIRLPLSGLMCRLAGEPAVLRGKVAEFVAAHDRVLV